MTPGGAPTERSVAVTCAGDISYNPTLGTDGKYTVTLSNETKIYTFKAAYTGVENGNYNHADATIQMQVTRHTSSGGSGSSSTSSVSVDTAKTAP